MDELACGGQAALVRIGGRAGGERGMRLRITEESSLSSAVLTRELKV